MKIIQPQALILSINLFLSFASFCQGNYIWDKSHTCKCFTLMSGQNDKTFTYIGNCKDGYVSGTAIVTFFLNGERWSVFSGNFNKGVLNGEGMIEFVDAYLYEGGIKNNDFHGKAKVTDFRTGEVIEANFNNGIISGDVKINYKNGDSYYGGVRTNTWTTKEGKGIYYFKNGDRFEGRFVKDVCEYGSMTYYKGKNTFGSLSGETPVFIQNKAASEAELDDLLYGLTESSAKSQKENAKNVNSKSEYYGFSTIDDAIDYLKTNFYVTTEKKEGDLWINLLGFDPDDDDYLTIPGKGIGKVAEKVIATSESDALSNKVTLVNNFKEYGIRWNKITKIEIEKEANGNNWLLITGPVETKEDEKLIANRLRVYVWADKSNKIRNALLYLSKNMESEVKKRVEIQKQKVLKTQREEQEKKEYQNYRFTSLTEAASYLEKVLNCNTRFANTVESKCRIPDLNQYMVIYPNDKKWQANYFSFASITAIEDIASLSCASCENSIKITVPVYSYQTHTKIASEFYFTIEDGGYEKAIKAFKYLKANASFGEPSMQNISEKNSSKESKYYEVSIKNNKNFDIYIAYANDVEGNGKTKTSYWYKFSPGETSLLFKAKNRAFCYYAIGKGKDGKTYSMHDDGSEYTMIIEGESKPAKCKVIPEGNFNYTLQIGNN